MKPTVLMITGAYYPELSGGGLQARAVVRALAGRANFTVLTTSADPALPRAAVEEGVPIRRVYVNVASALSKLTAAMRLAAVFVRVGRAADVVNLHGFSRKAILLVALSRLMGKRFALTLQTGGHDEPAGVRSTGALAYWAYRRADLYLSVSPGLSRAYLQAGLPAAHLRQVCNAVDPERFSVATEDEKTRLRRELNLPERSVLVLFVGFFSHDKRPDLLYEAWAEQAGDGLSTLLYVGATASPYQEVAPALAAAIRARAAAAGLDDRVRFVDSTLAVERYVRAADIYVLPSIREGLPIALLEAMASGLACVASRIPGSTDTIVDHGVNGLLVAIDDRDGFAAALRLLVHDRAARERIGAAATRTVLDRYSIHKTADAWLSAYAELSAAS
jgi:glycosyltransferase involved in cell wall biosynthesis